MSYFKPTYHSTNLGGQVESHGSLLKNTKTLTSKVVTVHFVTHS